MEILNTSFLHRICVTVFKIFDRLTIFVNKDRLSILTMVKKIAVIEQSTGLRKLSTLDLVSNCATMNQRFPALTCIDSTI
jgi:hypothetical protein